MMFGDYTAFLRRWGLVLGLGLVVGALLGYAYWSLSPVQAKVDVGPVHYAWPLKLRFGDTQWPPNFRLVGVTEPRPRQYESAVNLRITNLPTHSKYKDPRNKNLIRQGKDWAPIFKTR